jgi:hypothetical protein
VGAITGLNLKFAHVIRFLLQWGRVESLRDYGFFSEIPDWPVPGRKALLFEGFLTETGLFVFAYDIL